MTSTTPSELRTSAPLRAIADRFADHPQVGHMLATAAVLRTANIVTERVEAALAPLGLTMTRYEVLGLIESAGGRMTLRDLKRATMLHAATMTGTINALEERRLLRRELDADNRRVVVAVLTDKGATVARRAMAALSTAQFGLPDLSEDEALHIAECVARVGRTTSPA